MNKKCMWCKGTGYIEPHDEIPCPCEGEDEEMHSTQLTQHVVTV